jgi:phenylpyruvate tautomerase PptA (4-oxalocrotonate tautomerase family)
MPHISVNVPMKLTVEKEKKMVSRLGELITLIPGKDEKGLMISINDGNKLYRGGIFRERAAYLEVKIFKDCSHESKKEFCARTIEMLVEEFSIPQEHIYVTFFEVFNWAAGGRLMDV